MFASLDEKEIESALVEDFIFALVNTGCSSFIVPSLYRSVKISTPVEEVVVSCTRKFSCSQAPEAFRTLIESLLPLAEQSAFVQLYIDNHQGFDFGIVAQTLSLFVARSYA